MNREQGGRGFQPRRAVRQANRETLDRLRSLGYVGIAAPAPPGTRLPDPKDRIAERREYKTLMTRALDDLGAGRLREAERGLLRLAKINERAPDVHKLLGEVYHMQGRVADAERHDREALTLEPGLGMAEEALRQIRR